MSKELTDLAQCGDISSLESRLLTLCSEFGSLSRVDILTMTESGKRKAVCLLRVDSWQQEQDLMSKLGAVRFGDALCVVVELQTPERA